MRDVNIEIRLQIAGADWYGNDLNARDILVEIRDALNSILTVKRYQSIKVSLDKEGKYGKEEY